MRPFIVQKFSCRDLGADNLSYLLLILIKNGIKNTANRVIIVYMMSPESPEN